MQFDLNNGNKEILAQAVEIMRILQERYLRIMSKEEPGHEHMFLLANVREILAEVEFEGLVGRLEDLGMGDVD